MYNFKFVVVNSKGKATKEVYGSCHEAHVAMALYAASHDLTMKIHPGRWQEEARTVIYRGEDPMFGAVGYVAQCDKNDEEEE